MNYTTLRTAILATAACAPHIHDNNATKICNAEALAKDQAIADILNSSNRTELCTDYWLTDRGLVSDLATSTGAAAMSDAILAKLDDMAASSRSVAALVNRLHTDDRGVNFGDPALRAQFQVWGDSGALAEDEVAAILALAYRPCLPVSAADVSRAVRGPWE